MPLLLFLKFCCCILSSLTTKTAVWTLMLDEKSQASAFTSQHALYQDCCVTLLFFSFQLYALNPVVLIEMALIPYFSSVETPKKPAHHNWWYQSFLQVYVFIQFSWCCWAFFRRKNDSLRLRWLVATSSFMCTGSFGKLLLQSILNCSYSRCLLTCWLQFTVLYNLLRPLLHPTRKTALAVSTRLP